MPEASTVAPQSMRTPVDRGFSFPADPGARSAALDMHEAKSHPTLKKCERWPVRMRLLSSAGEVVKGRCKASNKCDYCATLAAVENSELLALDALMGQAPTVWAVTTTPLASPDTRQYTKTIEVLIRAWRRRIPDLEYGCIVEFTTGLSASSGGRRRPHWNWFFKNVNEDQVAAILDGIESVWCPRMEAKMSAQYVDTIANSGGLMRYLSMHFQKESQRPPAGWKGKRLRMSQGYLGKPTAEMRELTKKALRFRRELFKARGRGLTGADAESVAAAAVAFNESLTWELISWQDALEAADKRPWGNTMSDDMSGLTVE